MVQKPGNWFVLSLNLVGCIKPQQPIVTSLGHRGSSAKGAGLLSVVPYSLLTLASVRAGFQQVSSHSLPLVLGTTQALGDY